MEITNSIKAPNYPKFSSPIIDSPLKTSSFLNSRHFYSASSSQSRSPVIRRKNKEVDSSPEWRVGSFKSIRLGVLDSQDEDDQDNIFENVNDSKIRYQEEYRINHQENDGQEEKADENEQTTIESIEEPKEDLIEEHEEELEDGSRGEYEEESRGQPGEEYEEDLQGELGEELIDGSGIILEKEKEALSGEENQEDEEAMHIRSPNGTSINNSKKSRGKLSNKVYLDLEELGDNKETGNQTTVSKNNKKGVNYKEYSCVESSHTLLFKPNSNNTTEKNESKLESLNSNKGDSKLATPFQEEVVESKEEDLLKNKTSKGLDAPILEIFKESEESSTPIKNKAEKEEQLSENKSQSNPSNGSKKASENETGHFHKTFQADESDHNMSPDIEAYFLTFEKIKISDALYYIGPTKNNLFHGFGKLVTNKGYVIYVGYFYEGKYDGKGKLYNFFKRKESENIGLKADFILKFINLADPNFKKDIRGLRGILDVNFSNHNWEFYEGSFANGRREGIGKLVLTDGRIYEGEFKKGLAHGYGILRYFEKSVAGRWKENILVQFL